MAAMSPSLLAVTGEKQRVSPYSLLSFLCNLLNFVLPLQPQLAPVSLVCDLLQEPKAFSFLKA